jgi:hypothetical protein
MHSRHQRLCIRAHHLLGACCDSRDHHRLLGRLPLGQFISSRSERGSYTPIMIAAQMLQVCGNVVSPADLSVEDAIDGSSKAGIEARSWNTAPPRVFDGWHVRLTKYARH